MRKYYVKRNWIESMIELIGDVIELTGIRDGWDKNHVTHLREHTVARLKEIFLEEVEEEKEEE